MNMGAGQSTQLHVKSFFAANAKDALQQAHQEFGQDALLLDVREAPPEARHLGACEVVLGVAQRVHAPAPVQGLQFADTDKITAALEALERLLEARPQASHRPVAASGAGHSAAQPAAREIHAAGVSRTVEDALIDGGVHPDWAREIDQAVRQRIRKQPLAMARPGAPRNWDRPDLAAETAAELGSRFEVSPGVGRVTALVGPPGAGKTTTLVKLAVQEGLKAGRPTQLISADTQRIGGAEQLRAFAAILGVRFQAVEGTTALAQAVDGAPEGHLVLIDTPGYSRALQEDLGSGLADFLCRRQDIDTHLVLTASAQPAVLRRFSETYRPYGPSKLLFTRLDEVESLGSVYCEAARQKLPLSYFSVGQLIPEDLEAATKERVIESLVRRLPEDLQAVA